MKRRRLLHLGLLVLAAGLSLATPKKKTVPDPKGPGTEPTRHPAVQPSVQTRPAVPRVYPACPGKRGTITRAALQAILTGKPRRFLMGVRVDMVPRGKLPDRGETWANRDGKARPAQTFGGWVLRSFHPGDPCLGRSGLRHGDIIWSVNDNRLEKPTDLHTLWGALAKAPHIVVRLYRQGRPMSFVVRILP